MKSLNSHLIFAPRELQSQKPNVLYEYLESNCPKGSYLECFGRSMNLRPFWVTVGHQVLPDPSLCWIFLLPNSLEQQTTGSIVISN